MTKKDYILIASILKAEREHPASGGQAVQNTVKRLAGAFARALRQDNPRFDVDRFLDACGVPEEERNQ